MPRRRFLVYGLEKARSRRQKRRDHDAANTRSPATPPPHFSQHQRRSKRRKRPRHRAQRTIDIPRTSHAPSNKTDGQPPRPKAAAAENPQGKGSPADCEARPGRPPRTWPAPRPLPGQDHPVQAQSPPQPSPLIGQSLGRPPNIPITARHGTGYAPARHAPAPLTGTAARRIRVRRRVRDMEYFSSAAAPDPAPGGNHSPPAPLTPGPDAASPARRAVEPASGPGESRGHGGKHVLPDWREGLAPVLFAAAFGRSECSNG
jgi:hypothetical protein